MQKSYEEIYNETFKEIVELPDGTLNRDQVMRELADYSTLIDNVTRVYDCMSGGRISKPHTLPDSVISTCEEVQHSVYEYWFANEMETRLDPFLVWLRQMCGDEVTYKMIENKLYEFLPLANSDEIN